MLPALLLLLQSAGDPGPVYDGRARQLDVRLPRIDTTITIDGRLDEPVWQRAALLTGFSQYRPVDSRPAADSTEVLVWYTPDAIYFGVRAFESHGNTVRATLADRDNIDRDDRIHILLDTYFDHRRALLFAVNPLGVQQDGVWSDGVDAGAAGGPSAGGRFDATIDLNPDFVYQSRGHLTPWGFEVEVRIPFKSLRYQSANPQDWGLQIERITQHSGYEDTWTPAVRANASFLIQSGKIVGLTDLHRGLVMEAAPEFTTRVEGRPLPAKYLYTGTPALGTHPEPQPQRHREPRLLPGRGRRRPGYGEPAVRAVLSGEAAVFPGGARAVRHAEPADLHPADHTAGRGRQAHRQGGRHEHRLPRGGGSDGRGHRRPPGLQPAAPAARPRRQLHAGTRLYRPHRRRPVQPRARQRRAGGVAEAVVLSGAAGGLVDPGRQRREHRETLVGDPRRPHRALLRQ